MKVRIVIVVTLILSFITANVYADVTVDIVGRREVPFKNDFDNKTGDVVNINGLNIHLCSVNGQDCIYNTYAKNPRLIPYDDVAKSIGNTDYIHAGGYYLSRECEEDKAFVAYRPTNSLKVYDENLNLIFDENFGGGVYVTDMGYYNGRFYCIYNEKYKTIDDGKGGLKEERLSDNSLNESHLLLGNEKGLDLLKPLTRAEAVTLLVRALGLDSETSQYSVSSFSDIPSNNWASPYASLARAKGIAYGVSDTEFAPNAKVTADQFASFTLRAMGEGDFDYTQGIEILIDKGIITDKDAETMDLFTRGDMAKIVYEARAKGLL